MSEPLQIDLNKNCRGNINRNSLTPNRMMRSFLTQDALYWPKLRSRHFQCVKKYVYRQNGYRYTNIVAGSVIGNHLLQMESWDHFPSKTPSIGWNSELATSGFFKWRLTSKWLQMLTNCQHSISMIALSSNRMMRSLSSHDEIIEVLNLSSIWFVFGIRLLFEMCLLGVSLLSFNITSYIDDSL
jgi:hypothetical protein